MDTVASALNVFTALGKSLPFVAKFVKQHWIITVLYLLYGAIIACHFKNKTEPMEMVGVMFSPMFIPLWLFSFILGCLVVYYSVRTAVASLAPSLGLANKSALKCTWQIFCLVLIKIIAGLPLAVLLILPVFWWITKSAVSAANLVCTSDGPIESIKKSFKLTSGRFWQCFGYLAGVAFIIGIAFQIVATAISFALHASFMPDWDVASIKFGVGQTIAIFTSVIYCYCEAWLYVYLKAKSESPV